MTTQGNDDDPDRTELLATRTPATPVHEGDALPPGARIGRYRVEALLGRGGMGEVYRAEQLEPVRRTVALKLLRGRRLGVRHLAYFEVERQLLAQMRHPAIAQVYDADTTPDGHPWFAMEFIAGSPLTAYCDRHALPLRERLALLIGICEGVQHAHQKGVIHRDLKPGNLLVDEVDGRALPKIIDFGIATATSLGDRREIAGTPDYMSPEQAGGDQSLVDTRSDVYSLGVVLCELLTGQRPAAAGETVTDGVHTLRLPSRQLDTLPPGDADRIARAQGSSLPAMRRMLRHELDWVVARAMHHDRGGRYPSAAALADDLRRFLDGLPLQAVPRSRRYAAAKLVRRHRVGLAVAAVVLAALLGGLGLSLYGLMQAREQRAIAEQRSVELEKVAAFQQSMLEGVDIEAMGASVAAGLRGQLAKAPPADAAALEQALFHVSTGDLARGLVDRDILDRADVAIGRDFGAEPLLAADLGESVAGVRDALGLHEEAAQGFARVADARAGVLGSGAEATLSARQAQVAALLAAARPQPALELARATLADAAALPPDDRLRLRLELDVAEATSALGDRVAARAMMESLHARSAAAHGGDDAATLAVLNNLSILLARMGEPAQGREHMERVVRLREAQLGADAADTLAAQHNLATMRMMTGDRDAAIALQRRLVELQSRRLGAEHPQALSERANLATFLLENGELDAALPISEAVVEASLRVLGPAHPRTLRARLNLSTLHARRGDFERAMALQGEVADARLRLLGPRHPDTLFIQVNQAGTLHQAGRSGEALARLETLLPLARDVLGERHPQAQAALQIRGDAASALGRHALAVASYRKLLDIRREAEGEDARGTIGAAWELQRALARAGDAAQSAQVRSRYVAPLLAADPGTLDDGLRDLAEGIREEEAEDGLALR